MQDLPAEVSQDVPLVQGHKFVKFDDRILIVHPVGASSNGYGRGSRRSSPWTQLDPAPWSTRTSPCRAGIFFGTVAITAKELHNV
jgi:hypothetical protein